MAYPPAAQAPQVPPRFSFDDVLRRARDLASVPFDAGAGRLPDPFDRLDYDAWRDIRFRPDRAFFGNSGGPYRLQLFHLGHLYRRPVTINIIRDGIASPIPYTPNLFDYGRTKLEKAPPIGTGFAGFRLHYPLNDPRIFDEVIAFLGASYFRFLGRGQHYGISARGLSVGSGTPDEEFPFFREVLDRDAEGSGDRATIFALLDGRATTGAYRFELYPGNDSTLEVRATLFPRVSNAKFGFAPLTSMFFLGENDRRFNEDFRMELHDSDGLLVNNQNGEWVWRPLRNPAAIASSWFQAKDVRGFGLMQREFLYRAFINYQDLDLAYELRPSYWVEPHEGFADGTVELVELPTPDETNDNIVASFTPREAPGQGATVNLAYRIISSLELPRLSPNGRAINTFQTVARALGSREVPPPRSRRFLIDFAGGDLSYYLSDTGLVEVVPSIANGRILNAFVIANGHVKGLRAVLDVQVNENQTADIRAFLRAQGPCLDGDLDLPAHHRLRMSADGQRAGATVRRAKPSDVDRLVAIENAVFPGDRISRRSFHYQVRSPTLALLVATVEGIVHGYILLALRRTARTARIYSVAVDAARGRGLGRTLMEAGEQLARRRGYRHIRLEVRSDNARAIGIYERSGYTRVGERADYYEDGGSAFLYEKPLGPDQSPRRTRSRAKR